MYVSAFASPTRPSPQTRAQMRTSAQASAATAGASHRTLQPKELFARFYETKNGALPGEDLQKLFEDVYDEAHG